MNDIEEIPRIIEELGGPDTAADKLGVSRQTIWDIRKNERSNWRVYLYALRYLKFLPTLRRTKAFKEWVDDK